MCRGRRDEDEHIQERIDQVAREIRAKKRLDGEQLVKLYLMRKAMYREAVEEGYDTSDAYVLYKAYQAVVLERGQMEE